MHSGRNGRCRRCTDSAFAHASLLHWGAIEGAVGERLKERFQNLKLDESVRGLIAVIQDLIRDPEVLGFTG